MLLLFDIDGTLLSGATDAHWVALHEALRSVHRIDARAMRRPLAPAGRTDGEIGRAILLDAGVSAQRIDDLADEVREACCRAYAKLCPGDLSHTVLPGVVELLEWLSRQDRVRLGLLTGNYEPVARLKLARAGIGGYFNTAQGAFGSDAEDRAGLPAIARRRAGENGVPRARSETIVIGDTPRDIACAHADGIRCIAVASGPFTAAELDSADVVVQDAWELQGLLAARLTAWASGTGFASPGPRAGRASAGAERSSAGRLASPDSAASAGSS
jgi:phosphoglycolate phosphatase-like HAD superfamily hydrolase